MSAEAARLRAAIHRLAIVQDWQNLNAPYPRWCPDAIEKFAADDLDSFIDLLLDDDYMQKINEDGPSYPLEQLLKVKP